MTDPDSSTLSDHHYQTSIQKPPHHSTQDSNLTYTNSKHPISSSVQNLSTVHMTSSYGHQTNNSQSTDYSTSQSTHSYDTHSSSTTRRYSNSSSTLQSSGQYSSSFHEITSNNSTHASQLTQNRSPSIRTNSSMKSRTSPLIHQGLASHHNYTGHVNNYSGHGQSFKHVYNAQHSGSNNNHHHPGNIYPINQRKEPYVRQRSHENPPPGWNSEAGNSNVKMTGSEDLKMLGLKRREEVQKKRETPGWFEPKRKTNMASCRPANCFFARQTPVFLITT